MSPPTLVALRGDDPGHRDTAAPAARTSAASTAMPVAPTHPTGPARWRISARGPRARAEVERERLPRRAARQPLEPGDRHPRGEPEREDPADRVRQLLVAERHRLRPRRCRRCRTRRGCRPPPTRGRPRGRPGPPSGAGASTTEARWRRERCIRRSTSASATSSPTSSIRRNRRSDIDPSAVGEDCSRSFTCTNPTMSSRSRPMTGRREWPRSFDEALDVGHRRAQGDGHDLVPRHHHLALRSLGQVERAGEQVGLRPLDRALRGGTAASMAASSAGRVAPWPARPSARARSAAPPALATRVEHPDAPARTR